MKNLINLTSEVMEMFNINCEVGDVKIYTSSSKEWIIRLTSEVPLDDNWKNGNAENFLQDHPTVDMFLEDNWTLRVKTPEWYSGIKDFNLQPAEVNSKDLPGNVKSIEIIFNGPITLSDFKYYAVKEGLIELKDTDFSISENKIICRYDNKKSVGIRFYSGEKSVGVITIIDYR